MLLHHVPSAGSTKSTAGFGSQLVELAFRRAILDGPQVGIAQISLAFKAIAPGWRVGVFKVGHEDIRPGIQCIDNHLSFRRASNLHAAIDQVLRNWSDSPLRLANVMRLSGEPRATCPHHIGA